MRNEVDPAIAPSLLRRLRVLVTEDRALIASRITRALHGAGCDVLGPCPTLGEGLDLARREAGAVDAAVLDINLRGEAAYPLAEALRERGVPVLFLTGYGGPAIPKEWRGTPRLEKPFDLRALAEALGTLVAEGVPAARARAAPGGRPPDALHRAWETIRRQRDLISESQARLERTARATKPGDG